MKYHEGLQNQQGLLFMLKVNRGSSLFKIISYVTTVSFLSLVINVCYIHPAFADEAITTLAEGEAAPFSGTLFNTEAAARILVDLENSHLECKVKIDKAVAELEFCKSKGIEQTLSDGLALQVLSCM